jgi:hypothetical protein
MQGPLSAYQALVRPKLLERVSIVPTLPTTLAGPNLPQSLGGLFDYTPEYHEVQWWRWCDVDYDTDNETVGEDRDDHNNHGDCNDKPLNHEPLVVKW